MPSGYNGEAGDKGEMGECNGAGGCAVLADDGRAFKGGKRTLYPSQEGGLSADMKRNYSD